MSEKQQTSLKVASGVEGVNASQLNIDFDVWRVDLRQLHVTVDQVVQSFIESQTRQLDAVAEHLASQKERIQSKEVQFVELSDSIANFVEEEVQRLQNLGVPMEDTEADARQEAYDADLPGPPALHRINRLWRRATRAFGLAKEASEIEVKEALKAQRVHLEALVLEAEGRHEDLQRQHKDEITALQQRCESLCGEGDTKDSRAAELLQQLTELTEQLSTAKAQLGDLTRQLADVEALKNRGEYERSAEREDMMRQKETLKARVAELENDASTAQNREEELVRKCSDRDEKLMQMKKIMDDQEHELTTKIERVQQYVKERQTNALYAEKKQQDAERMAERWQGEVRRLQVEKDNLAEFVLEMETKHSGASRDLAQIKEKYQGEVVGLQDALRQKEHDMRVANSELLAKRDDEYQTKINLERQKEKERSIALLKRKDQELQLKDQQLRGVRQRLQELESSQKATSPNSSRGSSSVASRRAQSVDTLPPLPLHAR